MNPTLTLAATRSEQVPPLARVLCQPGPVDPCVVPPSQLMLPVPMANIAGVEDDPYWDMVLIGEGGYAGLVFIAQATWTSAGFDVRGYIVDTAGS